MLLRAVRRRRICLGKISELHPCTSTLAVVVVADIRTLYVVSANIRDLAQS